MYPVTPRPSANTTSSTRLNLRRSPMFSPPWPAPTAGIAIIARMSRRIRPMAMPLECQESPAGFGGLYAAMGPMDAIAERRILEAQARGDFDDLPGTGAPLQLDDDSLVAEDLRAAYRVLKNAGYLPPELEIHREIREI